MYKYYERQPIYWILNTKASLMHVHVRYVIYEPRNKLLCILKPRCTKYIKVAKRDYSLTLSYVSNTTMIEIEQNVFQEISQIEKELERQNIYEIKRPN